MSLVALLLDLANILGGLLLASGLLTGSSRPEQLAGRAAGALSPARVVIGALALATGGIWVVVHLTRGPGLFVFELVGIAVGVVLLWDRLRPGARSLTGGREGTGLLVAVLGLVAILVGIVGLFTPDG